MMSNDTQNKTFIEKFTEMERMVAARMKGWGNGEFLTGIEF